MRAPGGPKIPHGDRANAAGQPQLIGFDDAEHSGRELLAMIDRADVFIDAVRELAAEHGADLEGTL